MKKEEFGKLVTALRKEHRDENEQIWTQQKLAELTKLTPIIIGKIERGEKANLDRDALVRLANTFQLTSVEREKFFLCALGLEDHDVARKNIESNEILQNLVDLVKLSNGPAYLIDAYGDIIAANANVAYILNISSEMILQASNIPAGYNFMSILFAPDSNFRELLKDDWQDRALYNIRLFRAMSLKYRHTEYFQYIFKAIKKYPLFMQAWQQLYYESTDSISYVTHYQYRHPLEGTINCLTSSSDVITPYGDLQFVNYIPADVSTAKLFLRISEKIGTQVFQLAPWPNKIIHT